MAKTAFATWNNRIAPVFDVARSIQLVESQTGEIIHQTHVDLAGGIPNQKVWQLAELEVDTLVCGAISRPLQVIVAAYGIKVIPFVAGNLREVIQAWANGKLANEAAFAMPGCRNPKGRRFKGADDKYEEDDKMNGNKRGKKGAGQGSGFSGRTRQGQGGGGQRQGRGCQGPGVGSGVTSAMGTCICPKCGHQAPHERGVPCMQQKCAQCGASMTRQ